MDLRRDQGNAKLRDLRGSATTLQCCHHRSQDKRQALIVMTNGMAVCG